MDGKNVKIFDTTLRDGQQCPGAGMSFERNLEYARLAARLGVDVLEAGFPSASATDFAIVRAIAEELATDGPTLAGLCQLREDQVDRTIEALRPAIEKGKALLHTYLPVEPELMRASLGTRAGDRGALVRDVAMLVKKAAEAGCAVEFSPEGYSRMGENFDFVTDLIRAAVTSGATVINCPDTIGGASDLQGADYFVNHMLRHAAIIAEELPGTDVIWSVHCHNDFGLAVQNSINGVFRGPARQIEGCINGVGERAGNAALEQCIMIIKHFGSAAGGDGAFFTNVRPEHLQEICDFVSAHMLPRQPHWPVSGENAAKHSSGGHTNAILRNPLAYQPFDPREIGKDISFLFGPLSGGNHAKSIIESFGYRCDESEKAEIARFIKELYPDRRKGITDRELLAGYLEFRKPIRIDQFDYAKSANKAEVRLQGKLFDRSGEIHEEHEGRDSALAALKKTLDQAFGPFQIQSHRSQSDSAGIDANSISTIIIADEHGLYYEGIGADQDIEISAMKALIDAVNNAFIDRSYKVVKDNEPAHGT